MDKSIDNIKGNKCLIVANEIGIGAPGIVFETIIKELSKKFTISIISPSVKKGSLPLNVEVLPSVGKGFERVRLTMLSFKVFGKNLLDHYWLWRQKKIIDEDEIKSVSVIISFVSNEHYKGLILGHYLSKKYNKKWLVYSVDAIPAPIEWTNDHKYRDNTIKYVRKYLLESDAFFSSNPQMLAYQLNLLANYKGYSGVVFTPIKNTEMVVSGEVHKSDTTILYTGSIYGPRKIDTIIEGFKLFLAKKPQSKIIFVGCRQTKVLEAYSDLIKEGKIEIHGFSSDLSSYYKEADILLDVNAYFDNDVFLSSKIINYLPVQKVILSVTGENSPTRICFQDDDTIIHCKHDSMEVKDMLIKAANMSNNDYRVREKHFEMISVSSVTSELVKTINRMSVI